MNRLDSALQAELSAVMVPRYEPLSLLDSDGQRLLLAQDGIHCEIRRAWLHAILPDAKLTMRVPYGEVPDLLKIGVRSRDLVAHIARFIQEAKQRTHREHAAWMCFQPESQSLDYFAPTIESAGAAHIRYQRPSARPDYLPAIDCHSHALLPAFFSTTDDSDDAGDDAKLAFVVGNVDRAIPTVVMRLSAFGLVRDLSEWVVSLLNNGGVPATLGELTERTHD